MPTKPSILIIVAVAAISGCSTAPDREREAWVRGYASEDAGARAAIQRLSQELQKDTNKSIYRVHWSAASTGPSDGAVLYLRQQRIIGYESQPYSGHTSTWTNVDIQAVHTLAAKRGRFEDLRPRDWPPEQYEGQSSTLDLLKLHREFGTLLSRKFEVTPASSENLEDLRSILVLLKKTKKDGPRFDAIHVVEFESSAKAKAIFSWAGLHGGWFILEKKNGTWVITDDFFAV